MGLIYTAGAPMVKQAGFTLPIGGAAAVPAPEPEPAPVVPHGRYEPPARPRPAEKPPVRLRVEETTAAPPPAPAPVPAPKRSSAATVRRSASAPPAPSKPAARPAAPRGEFSANPKAAGEVALTFDAAYDDSPLPSILQALEGRGYRATFFLTGGFADRYPKSVKRIADAGMEIGNHSWSHPAFTKLSDAQIVRELKRTNDLIEEITGQTPDLFRPPFGARDDRVRRIVAREGYATIYWALDCLDSVRKGITAREITDRVLSRVRPGDVVLMHIGSAATAEALPDIMKGLDERGLRVVTVTELMEAS